MSTIQQLQEWTPALKSEGFETLARLIETLAVEKAAQPMPPLAPNHEGMRVDYQGLLGQARRTLGRNEPMLAEMLRQFQEHIQELGQRYYQGDAACVDKFLQLYCVEHDARTAVAKAQGGAA